MRARAATTYGPSATPPTNLGTYAVTATVSNANYTGSGSGTLTIISTVAATVNPSQLDADLYRVRRSQ